MTYYLDDKSSFYHGREVVLVNIGSGVVRTVKVKGTNVSFITTLWRLAASPEGLA
jgi:hypothetical protein